MNDFGSLDAALVSLKAAIETLEPKTQRIITDWVVKWSGCLTREKGFDPSFLPYFKRGDIVYANFGFNVGSE